MTTSTTPLVDVIAGVLADTPYESLEDCARAVLAALEQAGSVQYGVKGEGRVKEYGRDRRRAQLAARGRGAAFVSRITGPWEPVKAVSE